MSDFYIQDVFRWYVIYSYPKQEDRVDLNLRAWGVESFNPKLKVSRRNPYTDALIPITKSLFPRYLFARFKAKELFAKVSNTRGVCSVVNFGGGPIPINDEVIKVIRSRMREDGFVRFEEDFEPGDRVLINSGLFHNLMGIFDRKVKSTDRVRILLENLSYEGHITIEKEAITKI